MGRVFFKGFFATFLAFMLFINMAYAFDMVHTFGFLIPSDVMHYENYYFGFRNLLEFINEFDNSGFLYNLKQANNTYIMILDKNAQHILAFFAGELGPITDIGSFFNALTAIVGPLAQLIFSFFYILWFVIYILCIVGFVVIHFFISIFGYYSFLPSVYPV